MTEALQALRREFQNTRNYFCRPRLYGAIGELETLFYSAVRQVEDELLNSQEAEEYAERVALEIGPLRDLHIEFETSLYEEVLEQGHDLVLRARLHAGVYDNDPEWVMEEAPMVGKLVIRRFDVIQLPAPPWEKNYAHYWATRADARRLAKEYIQQLANTSELFLDEHCWEDTPGGKKCRWCGETWKPWARGDNPPPWGCPETRLRITKP